MNMSFLSRRLVVFLVLSSVSAIAPAGQWYPIYFDDEYVLFFDKSQYRADREYRTSWFSFVFEKPSHGSDNQLVKMTANCKADTYKFDYYVFFNKGSRVESSDGDKKFSPVVPDTVSSKIYKALCGLEPYEGDFLTTIDVEKSRETLREIARERREEKSRYKTKPSSVPL